MSTCNFLVPHKSVNDDQARRAVLEVIREERAQGRMAS